ncbi:MAG: hypothetical protein Q8O53_02995 [Candidatus Moranbacteria bacterium]|nr:hypothetical protein [Candidatus Moranbacteria bacterium]
MDILSHGLYGGVAFGRRSWKSFWLSFSFGIAPDLFSFGLYMGLAFFGLAWHPSFLSGQHPGPNEVPAYVNILYNVTHSLLVFALVFGAVWLLRQRPLWEMTAWGLHIVVDIPTHVDAYFATPFLWPLSSFHVSGIPWGHPIIFIPNILLLVGLYLWFFVIRKFWRRPGGGE